MALQVGQNTESVTVTAESSLLKTESSELVSNTTLSELNNLPVLQVGATNDGVRDLFSASKLQAGVQYTNSGLFSAVVFTVINGTPSNTLQTRLDGATMNPTSTRLGGATMETQPSVDAIQEIAIQTSNFAAEFEAGGAMVNLVTKSGTNQFHGSLYDYAVNEILNAGTPYTILPGSPNEHVRNPVKQHGSGVTFGGPVRIPKVYDGTNKTFFFFSFEQFRVNTINNTLPATVPIAAYRQGDFSNLITAENRLLTTATGVYTDPLGRTIQSGTIFDPRTERLVGSTLVRDPFPGNRIPTDRFDPVAAKILGLVPNPQGPNANQAGRTNSAAMPGRVSNIPSFKLDQSLSWNLHF